MRAENPHTALILVDLQNDFLPGGPLPVPEGDEIVPIANRLQPHFDLVVATQDWHPPGHVSFASNHPGKQVGDVIDVDGLEQLLWPVHCVQHTSGADLASGLDAGRIAHVVHKGTDPCVDSYSGFFDNGRRRSTGLAEYLQERGISTVYLMGLATDYCVKHTAIDASRMGLKAILLEDACRGVNVLPGDVEKALEAMVAAGVQVETSDAVLHVD